MPKLAANPPIKPVRLVARRWLISATLVFASYNPSGHSYWHWATAPGGSPSLEACIGIFLLAAWVAVARMAFAALGYRGVAAVVSLIIAAIVFRVGLGWLIFANVAVTGYTILLWISTVLGIGLSWSFLQRRISGEKYVLKSSPP
jgi:hypothetical protein